IVYPRYADGPPAAPTRDRQPAELVPPGRLERPHPAPEAGALSAELWGLVARIPAPSSLYHIAAPASSRTATINVHHALTIARMPGMLSPSPIFRVLRVLCGSIRLPYQRCTRIR